ncbi:MAG: hypothetical protein ACO3QV_07530, partial [Candidatus Nanopelagicaceae bacterium]
TSTGELVGPTDGSHTSWNHDYTKYMLQWLKVETGVGAVGIFITPSKRNVEHAISDKYKNTNSLTKALETFKQNDAIAFGEYNGYSQYIMMMVSNKKIKGLEDVESGAKPMVVANAMIREAKKTKGMTRIMDSFVDTIAVEG